MPYYESLCFIPIQKPEHEIKQVDQPATIMELKNPFSNQEKNRKFGLLIWRKIRDLEGFRENQGKK